MTERNDYRIFQLVNLIAILLTLIVDALANIIPINGVLTGDVADSYPNLFTPPGWVFAIWGVIYVLLAVFMVYQARPSQRNAEYLPKIGYWHLLGAIGNVTWIFLFHYSAGAPSLLVASTLPIVLLLISLLFIYTRLGIGVNEVPLREKLAVHLPVSVYLGWISLATIANVASALNVLIPGIPVATQEIATAAMVIVAFVLTLLMLIQRRDLAFGLVVVWASSGIALKQIASPVIFFAAAGVAILVAILIVALPLIKKKKMSDYYLARD
ncbi:tryptophan-rich sensory protein [Candidatus Thorarchaeota archaeon]|nr:MAG: tryptophan-rich sensory protein [Candidatus Thorarchaeota archaeon]